MTESPVLAAPSGSISYYGLTTGGLFVVFAALFLCVLG